jgi:chromosome segregation ATPase
MSKNQLEHKDETRRSKFFGRRKADQKSDNHPKKDTSDSTDNNSVNHQLEKLCKVHQFTVMKQRKELVFLRTAIETKEDEILKLRNEIKSNEAQITVLENHFMELNSDSTVQLSLVRKSSEDSIERPSSIIKVDAAYVSELESERKSNANMITDFRNQINELKTRNDELMKSQEKANELNDHIEKLKAQVKARELSINALEKAYEQQQMNTFPDNCPTLRVTPRRYHSHRRIFSIDSAVSDEGLNHAMSSIASTEGDVHNLSLDDTNDSLTPDQLRCKLVASESRIHKLEAKIASFERIKNETGSSEKAIVARLRKVNLLQEMVEAASRRLNNILNKLEESKQEQPETESEEKIDMGDVLSLGTKLNVIQDNVMVSLRLLEIRLSNELESMRSGVATNNGNGCEQQNSNSNSSKQNTENESRVMDESESAALVEVRFNRTMESLNEIEKQMNENVEKLKMEIRHYDLKLGVKDDIIEGLIQSEKELKETIETLREEVEVFKSLESFSSVNVGVMARFKECRRLENEVKEKDRVIQRLNVVIEEYRTV